MSFNGCNMHFHSKSSNTNATILRLRSCFVLYKTTHFEFKNMFMLPEINIKQTIKYLTKHHVCVSQLCARHTNLMPHRLITILIFYVVMVFFSAQTQEHETVQISYLRAPFTSKLRTQTYQQSRTISRDQPRLLVHWVRDYWCFSIKINVVKVKLNFSQALCCHCDFYSV